MTFSAGGRTSEAQFVVLTRGPDYVRFGVVVDNTPIANWLTWREADARWEALDADHTRLSWSLSYERRLDPAWYFGPLERFGAEQAADYLIQASTAPR